MSAFKSFFQYDPVFKILLTHKLISYVPSRGRYENHDGQFLYALDTGGGIAHY